MQEFSRALRSPAPVVINPPWSVNARELNGRRWSHLLFVVLLGIPLAVHAGEPKTYQGAASQAFSQFFAANRNDDCTAHSWPYDRDLFVYAEMPHCSWLTKVTASGFCDDAVRISGISNYIDVGFGDCVANNFSVDATHCVDQAARDLRFAAFDKTNIGDNNNMGVSGDVAYEFTVTTFTLYDSYVGLEVDGVVTWYGLSGTGLGKVPSVVTGNAVRIVGCDVKTSPGGGGYCGCDQVKLTVSQSGGSSIQQDMIWDSNVNGNDKWRIASAISRTFKPGDVVTLRFDGKMDGFPAGWARELKYANNGEGASFSIVENRIDLKGRVLDHKTRAPLPGATVKLVRDGSVAGTTTTGSDGRYSFGGLVAGGTVDLIFTNFSYLTQQCSVTLPTNGKEVTAPDIYLARLTSKPVVERIEEDVSGIWLPGFNQTLETKVYVNWNGNRPGTTYVYANGRQGFDTLIGTIVNDRAVYRVSFPVDSYFLPSIAPGANMITAQAASRDGSSEVVSLEVNVLPVPVSLEAFRNYWNITEQGPGTSVGMDFKFPNPPMAGMRNVPLIGPVGCTLAAKMGFSYDVVGAAWSIYAGFEGAGTNAIRFGDTSIGLAGDITGKGSWPKHAVPKTEVSGKITASISPAEITLFRISPLGLLGSAFRSYINKVPYLRSILRAVTVSVIAKPEGVGEFAFSLHPQCQVESGTFSGKIAVFGKYEPKFGKKFKLSIVVGGEPRFVFQVSWDPFKEAAFKVYASAETEIFSLQQKFEHVVIDWAYTNSLLRSQTVLDVASPEGKEGWQFVERTWRRRPTAVSLLDSIHGSLDPVDSSALDRFSALGKTWPPGCAVSRKPARSAAPRVVSSIPSLAELPLLGNVYPDSSPALATRADTILLVYVRDNGAVNPAQFTEIAWTYYDGTNWTAPGAIAPVPNGQFSPRVAFDGAGRALAVWEQVKDPDFATNDLDLMAAEIEVMAAVWNPVTRAWDAPTAITDNGHLDHTPQLGGPLASGDLLLAWVANEGNQFGGSGDAGSISNSTYWTRTWSSASASWSPSMALATGLVFELGASLAAGGSRGVLAWTRDLDGETEELEEADIFSCMYDDASHSWSEALNRTADAVSDSEVQVVVGSTGQVCMVWRRGDDLVMDSEEGGTPALVRSNVTSMGFGDFALSFSPDGYLAAIWQDENRMGSDAHCRIWDPASSSWSQDMLLSEDEDLERSFALGWDAMGNLLMAYNNVALVWTSKVVELEGGGSVTISNIPDSGQVDLLIARRALVRDLAIATNGLAVTGTNFQPGATVAITARVANVGCVAIENPVVAFYDGDPASGGVRIGHVTNAGWLRAAADVACGLTWELPSTAVLHRVYAVVDPDGAVTEYSETNNSSSLAIGGIDVDISYVRGSVMTDGSVRVVGRIENIGSPGSPSTTLALWLSDTTSVVALTNLEIRGLAPGEYLETSFDLPAGTQPTGTVAYRMAVDEAGEMQDVDRSNNECLFTLTSWREAPEDYRQYRAVASGGTTLVISNDLLGADADITNVLVDGQSAVIRAQGAGWVQVVLPAHTADIVSIHVQSESLGDRLLYRVLGYEDSVSKQWTGATDAQWGNATNWSASGSPGPADVVYFNALATQNLSAVLEGEATALRVVQRNPAGPVTITSTGQILTLGLGLDLTNAQQDLTIEAPLRLSGDQLWSVTNGRTLAVRGPVWADGNAITVTGAGTVVVGGDLVGGASLLKAGSGTLVVTGETSFAAGIAVDAGSLQVGNNTPSGRLHGSVTNKANLYFHRSDGGIMSNSVAGPGITYVKGSVGYGGALSNGQLLVAQDVAGQLCVLDGADVTVSNLYLGNPSYIPGTLIQSGGSVRVWGYPYTMRIGHWQFETSCYTLAGGELNVSPGQLSIGWNGRGVFEVAGGTANVQVLQINANGPFGTTDGGALIMTGGRLNLGAGGMSAPSARAEAYLGGGTLGALASWSDATSAVYTITGTNGNLTVDPGAYTITLNGRFSGTGGLVKVGAGTLVMGGDSTYAGGTQVRGGILQLGTNGTAGHVIGPITNDGVIVFNRTGNTGVTSVISGVGEVVKMGGNRIGLEAGNTYAGRTRVLGGYLCLTNDTGLGAVPDVPVADQLVLDGGMLANMNAAFARPPDHLTLHAHRGVHLGPGHGVFRTAWSSNTYVNGVISGPGRLRKTDGGTLILNAANLHTNATEWVDLGVNFGTIRLGHTQALQYSTLNMYSNASAVLDLNGLDGAVLGGLAGGATNSAIINIPAGSHLQVGNNNSDTTFAGILAGGGLSKIGTGRLTLASAQSYVGPTVISSGVLRVESGLATGVIQVTASGALELPGGSVVGGDLEVSGEVRLLPGDLGVAAAGGSYTQAEGAVFSVELVGSGGPSPTSGCARLGVSGAAHLGGILSVTATGGIWEAGSCLTILTANAISGDFAATNLPVASTGRWVVEKESQKVMLRLQAMTVADVALQGLLQVYSGASRVVTALTTPPDLDVDITYDGNSAAPVNAGTYMVTGVVTEAGYSGGATGILVVQQAVAAVHLVDLDRVYHGGPQSVTATTDPAGLVVVVTYEGGSAPVLAGLYAVTAAVNELNYAGATDGVLRIARAVPSVLWTQPVAVAYGTVLGDNQLNATSDVPGSFLYTPGSGALLPPGLAHPLSARFDPEDAANYTSTTASVLLDVHPTLEATAGVHGAISPSGWIVVPYGSNAEFVVQAQQYFHVASVATNGVPMAGVPVAAVCTVVWENVVATGLVEALFLADLSAQGVPHWWLAGYGWAGELNDAATNDPDQDRMLTWQEFWAGTDPTNRDSFLGMNQAAPAAGGGFVIRWQSVTGRSYAVARSVNLRAQPAFTAIFEHVTGLAGHTSVTDTQADVIGPRVYRVEVEP